MINHLSSFAIRFPVGYPQVINFYQILLVFILDVSLFTYVSQASVQIPQISPEWKAHFKATPVIENCVFERKVFSGKGETNLYQFRYQENAFLFRQIRGLSDASSNNIPIMLGYAGRFGSNCWAIDWTADTFGVLKLFPNADDLWRKPPESGDAVLLYAAERQIFATLYYGIANLNPATIKWPEETKFTASMVNDQKILGDIMETSNGLPSIIEWHYENAPDAKFRFILEYNYETKYALPYYPSEIRLFSKSNGQQKIAVAYKILMLTTSRVPLGETYFDPKTYFLKPISPHPRISTLLFSNNEIYNVSDGASEKVVPVSAVKSIISGGTVAGTHPIVIRCMLIAFFVASMIGLLFVWRKTK